MATAWGSVQAVNTHGILRVMPESTSAVLQNCIALAKKIRQNCHTVETECEELVVSLEFLNRLGEVRQRERIDQDFSICKTFNEAALKYLVENKQDEANALEIFTALQRGNFRKAKLPKAWSRFWGALNSHNMKEPLEVVTGGSEDRETWVIRLRPTNKQPLES